MSIYAISDLHLANKVNKEALINLPEYKDDWIVLAGDIGETIEQLEFMIADLVGRKMTFPEMTLGQFVEINKRGSYYVHIRGHAMAIIDGQLFDWKSRGKTTRIRSFIKID